MAIASSAAAAPSIDRRKLSAPGLKAFFRIAEMVSREMTFEPIAAWMATSYICLGMTSFSLAQTSRPR